MARSTSNYRCTECGWSTPKWAGRCAECHSWGTVLDAMDTEPAYRSAPPRSATIDSSLCTTLSSCRMPSCSYSLVTQS